MFCRTAAPALCAALAVFAVPARAQTQPRARPASTVAKAIPLPADTLKRLKGGDEALVHQALDDVRMSARAGAPAVPSVVALLKQGLRPTLTRAALEALGDTENDQASEVLGWYAHHRDASLRRAAVEALARTRAALAIATLRASLSDQDPRVRGLAATGLGEMKAKDAVGDLFVALDHRVAEAAAAIGQLCAPSECDKLASKLGSVPFEVVTSGLERVLFRPLPDVNDELKVKIVGRVRELGTAEANRFLRDAQGRWPKGGSTKVKQSLDQAVLATSASPGSEGSAQ
ncbi:MAG: HEAT repeat domain-containing protein [Myxococcota bacterium]|nr:HEAT repeat domain-containing protein [Myxococcota bacterium]